MAKFLLGLTLLLCAPQVLPQAQTQGILTAGELYGWCNSSDAKLKGACKFYIWGFVEGVAITNISLTSGPGASAVPARYQTCIPEQMTSTETIDVVMGLFAKDFRAFPLDKNAQARTLLAVMLTEAYPCFAQP